ncbi:unnamed protein product [Clonostachys byssicola]|uniref:WW domain-containing protein n=1 Tax=Clonostachys byssicola TaxID=160290 RepID=A0A9N9XXD4_9HYPO|nr:unnamed protein product [Clonostachys byssicola]
MTRWNHVKFHLKQCNAPAVYVEWYSRLVLWWPFCTLLDVVVCILIALSQIGFSHLSQRTFHLHIVVASAYFAVSILLKFRLFKVEPKHRMILFHLVTVFVALALSIACFVCVVIETPSAKPKLAYFFLVLFPPLLGLYQTIPFYLRDRARTISGLQPKSFDVVVTERFSLAATKADGRLGQLYIQQLQSSPSVPRSQGSAVVAPLDEDEPPIYRWQTRTWTSCDDVELPDGWSMTQDEDGKRRFWHTSKPSTAIWRDPRRRTGWTCDYDAKGRVYYIDHNNRYTTWNKPPLPNVLGSSKDRAGRRWESIWINRYRRFLLVNHSNGLTTWTGPKGGQPLSRQEEDGHLPPGWQKVSNPEEEGERFFSHNSLTYVTHDPRLTAMHRLPQGWYQNLRFDGGSDRTAQVSFFDKSRGVYSDSDPRLLLPDGTQSMQLRNSEKMSRWGSEAKLSWRNTQPAEIILFHTPYMFVMWCAQLVFNIVATVHFSRTMNGIDWLLYPPWVAPFTTFCAYLWTMRQNFYSRWLIMANMSTVFGFMDTFAWAISLGVNAAALHLHVPNCEVHGKTHDEGICKDPEFAQTIARICQIGMIIVGTLALPASVFGLYLAVTILLNSNMREWIQDTWLDTVDWQIKDFIKGSAATGL